MDENKIQKQLDELVEMVGVMSGMVLTKDDAKQFATKEDLKQFATKEDLKQFATKEDLKQFATKEDLKQLENKMDAGFVSVRAEMDAGFASVHTELSVIKQEVIDIRKKLSELEKRTREDADAAGAEIVKLRERMERVEKKLKILDPSFA